MNLRRSQTFTSKRSALQAMATCAKDFTSNEKQRDPDDVRVHCNDRDIAASRQVKLKSVRQLLAEAIMIPKYTVEYQIQFRRHSQVSQHHTDDPVACEEFLVELLERGFLVRDIKHEGVSLSKTDFDKMLKTAAGMLASKHLCVSLAMKPEEERFRFGFAA